MTHLNESQRKAVLGGDGHALVLAGAGSGKTRVIVERIAYLIGDQGVDPRCILALTFTNKAAGEMRDRVTRRLGVDKLASWLGTFHSFGLYVLRRDIDKLGRNKNFTVFDDADQLSIMKSLVKELPQSTAISPRDALAWISRLKQDLADPDSADAIQPPDPTLGRLWSQYHAALARVSAVDFDDLLVLVARLFEEHPDVREKYSSRFRYVLIDEYQDTNRAQYIIARSLSETHGNLFVVGDEDQAIYSWRGATIRNMLDFEKDFPNARVFRLEQNYRSTAPILDAANAVVAHNTNRLGKTLWTAEKGGEPVRLVQVADGEAEAGFVANDIVQRNLSPGDAAVLFRTNGQSRLIEEALRRKGLAYVVVGGTQFYGRKEIKDLVAYLRLLVNPRDDVSLRRILNVPPRGIGATSQATFEQYASNRGQPLLQVLRDVEMDQTLPARARQAVAGFVHLIDDLALMVQQKPVAALMDELLERSGYRSYTQQVDAKDFRTRLEMVDEFRAACAQFDAKGGQGGLAGFLQDLALLSDVDTWDSSMPAVTLLTCHSAKGLEFNHVYLIGLEEGFLPHANAQDAPEDIEEERRLCYVAMTRARRSLTLCAARLRVVYGGPSDRVLSRFVGEIPGDRLSVMAPDPGAKASPTPARAAPVALKMGVRVWHPMFGKGTVMYTSGSGPKLEARVRFESGRSVRLKVEKAPLKVIDGDKR